MAIYVSSVTGDNSDGKTWITAKTSISGGLSLTNSSSTGSIIYVDSNHSFASSSQGINWDAASAGLDVSIISVDRASNTGTDFGNFTTGATETVGTNAFGFNVGVNKSQSLYLYGIQLNAASGINSSNIINVGGSAGGTVTFQSCTLNLAGSNSNISLGQSQGNGRPTFLINILNSTVLSPPATNAKIFTLNNSRTFISNLSLKFNSSISKPQTFFSPNSNVFTSCEISNSDLSVFTGSQLVSVTTFNGGQIILRNCQLNSISSMVGGSWLSTTNEPSILVLNSDSNGSNTQFRYYNPLGTLLSSETFYKNQGASNNETNVGWQITTTTSCNEWEPFRTPWLTRYNNTISIESGILCIIRDSISGLNDRQIWSEIEYPSGASQGTYLEIRNKRPFDGTGVIWSSGTETWNGTFTNPYQQTIGTGFTQGITGLIRQRLLVGISGQTIYLDPLIKFV